jgi:hypothetical protein
MSSLSRDMQKVLLSTRRQLCWLWWIEGQSADLYAWSGTQPIDFDGNTYLGVGHVAGMATIQRTDGLEHVEQQLILSGLDPSVVADLDTSVRGREATVRLGALNTAGQIVREPILVQQLVQDTLKWERKADGSVSLTLTCFEALPQIGRATGAKWSFEAQLEAFSNDHGFYYNTQVSRQRGLMDWRPSA